MTTAVIQLPALDWKVPMVDPATGRPSPEFQRKWQLSTVKITLGDQAAIDLSGKVDKNTSAGWSAATGTASKSTFATYSSPVISATYSQAEVQALADHVQILSQHVKSIVDALLTASVITT